MLSLVAFVLSVFVGVCIMYSLTCLMWLQAQMEAQKRVNAFLYEKIAKLERSA